MGAELTIRLTDQVRDELVSQAQSRGIDVATLASSKLSEAVHAEIRARVRAAVAEMSHSMSPETRAYLEEIGTPDWAILEKNGH